MLNEARIFGYVHENGECYCVLCTQLIYGFALNDALGRGIVVAVRLEYENVSALRCSKCRILVLAASRQDIPRLDVWREHIEKVDLGKELGS